MKARFQIFVILTFALLVSACKTTSYKSNSPEAVATKFMKHLGAWEFDEARKLGTYNTNKYLDLLQTLIELSKEKGQEGVLEKKEINIKIIDTKRDGNTAVVSYMSEDGSVQTLNLVKEKGKWLVDMKKEIPLNGSLNGGG